MSHLSSFESALKNRPKKSLSQQSAVDDRNFKLVPSDMPVIHIVKGDMKTFAAGLESFQPVIVGKSGGQILKEMRAQREKRGR
ncbi:MAG: hypothetical protein V4772_25855 [Pseudomonadota bacterium]